MTKSALIECNGELKKCMRKPIFISYKRVDKEVYKIKDYIEGQTGVSCWIDLDGIESDAFFNNVIIDAINACDVMLFMYSKSHSNIGNIEEDWTVKELRFASKRRKRIVFVNIDGSPLTDYFEFNYGMKQQVDASDSSRMQRLVSDIKKWIKIPADNQVSQGLKKDPQIIKDSDIEAQKTNETIIESENKDCDVDSEEAYQKGREYYYGKGEKRDLDRAFGYFEQAANLNHRKAQEHLSKYYLLGLDGKKDQKLGEYWLALSQLPDGVVKNTPMLPKSLGFEYSGRKWYMVLSDDESYYLGNLNAKENDMSWLDNKWIQTMGVGAVCAGAVMFSIVSLPIVIILALKALSSIFSDNSDQKSARGIVVDSDLCEKLSKSTGYNLAVPTITELKGVKSDMQSGCIVLRVSDNPKLLDYYKIDVKNDN